jgi:hypothetical protein
MAELPQPKPSTVWLATLVAAPLAAAVVTALLVKSPFFAPFGFILALPHAVALGLPTYRLAQRLRLAGFAAAVICGALIGAIPIGLLTVWSVPGSSAYDEGAWQVVDDVRTSAGWVQWGKLVGFLAANGSAGGAAFWATIRFWPDGRRARVDPEVFA